MTYRQAKTVLINTRTMTAFACQAKTALYVKAVMVLNNPVFYHGFVYQSLYSAVILQIFTITCTAFSIT